MSIPLIGSIHASLYRMKLNVRWQQRQQNPNLPKGREEDPQLAHLKKSAEDVRKGQILSAITGKLNAGGELTPEELEYLKNHNPQMYQEAMEIKQEREAYKKKLAACKTKEDVDRLHTQSMQNFLSQAKSIRNNPNLPLAEKKAQMEKIQRRMMGIQTEQRRFIQSKAYSDLPSEIELQQEKEKKKKKRDSSDWESVKQQEESPYIKFLTSFDLSPEKAEDSGASQASQTSQEKVSPLEQQQAHASYQQTLKNSQAQTQVHNSLGERPSFSQKV